MTVSFRGHNFDDSNGISLTEWAEVPPIEGRRIPLRGDGAAFEQTSRAGRSVELTGQLKGNNAGNFDTRHRELLKVLQDPTEGTLILDTFKLPCRPRPGKIQIVAPLDASHAANWSCVFESEEPFWEETPSLIASKTLTDNGVSEESFTITYDADLAPSYPLFEIESLKSSLVTGYEITFRNDSTGEELRLVDFDLGQNDILTVDPYAEQVYISTQTTGNAVAPRRVDGVFWPITGASITCVVKHNQQGSSPNFSVDSQTRKWHYAFRA